jgi:hypothetical protein
MFMERGLKLDRLDSRLSWILCCINRLVIVSVGEGQVQSGLLTSFWGTNELRLPVLLFESMATMVEP